MKKFTNLDAEHHHYENNENVKNADNLESGYGTEDCVDSIMISGSENMLEETTTHLMQVNQHKREMKISHQ